MKIRFPLLLLLLALSSSAWAEAHYSAIFGQSCFLCHANPTGRGERSLYGSQFFAPNYLPVRPLAFEQLDKIKPQLSESVIIGADLRTIWMSENSQSAATEHQQGLSAPLASNTGTMSLMEGSLYLTLQPSEQFLIYLSRGVADHNGRFEAYGLAEVLPFHGFVKAGQFQESFGWAFADHSSYVRAGLYSGLDDRVAPFNGSAQSEPIPPHYGTGAEIGARPWWLDLSASFTSAQINYPLPTDQQKRWFARAQLQRGLEKFRLQFTAGGSYIYAPRYTSEAMFTDKRSTEAWGGFGGIGWQGLDGTFGCSGGFGFLTTALLFEYDRKDWNPTGGADVVSAYSTTQLNTMLQPGIWLSGQYDWLENGDPDGSEAERTSIGLQVFPLPWIDIQPRYRLYSSSDRARNTQHAELMVHFQF
ncbi:hypothetical protein HZB60_11240 [candidate division KSB1 bacterium]|nr:hypothetical protein [candidate division KSB1 bacterium]